MLAPRCDLSKAGSATFTPKVQNPRIFCTSMPGGLGAESWPEAFPFSPKTPKAISHEGKLVDNIGRAREFVEVMRPLGTRLGPMFLQLPPRYGPKLLDDLKAFF